MIEESLGRVGSIQVVGLAWVNINNLYFLSTNGKGREGGREEGEEGEAESELDENWGDGDGGAHFL